MTVLLPEDRMPEAEVSLRLAFHLLELPEGSGEVEVSIDGAQVRVHGRDVFRLREFLESEGWRRPPSDAEDWSGTYRRSGRSLIVHSRPGVGDVVGAVGGARIRAECKKGLLSSSASGEERKLLREALAQLLTVETVGESDILVAVVPDNPLYRRLAEEWRTRPLVRASGIRIALVGRDGTVEGL